MINSLNDRIMLNNGTAIPGLGLGVFQIPDADTAQVVANGIKNGYRLIDTAQIYGNEAGTGAGIKAGLAATGLKRADLFVTSKVWNDHLSYDETIAVFESSLKKLGLDYLDLYLIHWPGDNAFQDAWRALETLYKQGKIKAIGVSNFQIHHLQAWSPLMQGKILDNAVLAKIAQKYNKSVAQIVLRWDVQQNILLVVKSVRAERMLSNAQIFDFELAPEDMDQINALNENLRVGPNPDEFDF
ncbi:2,5-didehydrogluconate reductase (2-dehydro-L-gulonate-forming) [Pediococcus pentosaceus]|uniref:2,5-didehydrogluconate reductase (2-dehydro-L-gulonate-forming) n=1 Tax=Pediococcus pentosaceus TaxID=1255 RepID=A0A1Y0VX81_PEDPE|nr:2,5-didehydrogluconate reductase (2-dehydro-L-gulonate-forming) [Pediococcus pentosaceus]